MRWPERLRLRSLRAKLGVSTALGMLLTSAAVTLAFFGGTVFEDDALARHGVIQMAEYAADHIDIAADGRPIGAQVWPLWQWVNPVLPADLAVHVVGDDGRAWSPAGRDDQWLPGAAAPLVPGYAHVVVDGRTVNVGTVRTTLGGRHYTVQVAMSMRLHRLATDVLRVAWTGGMAITVAAALPVLLLIMVWTLHRLLRPLEMASAAAARIDARNLSARVATDGVPNELLPLITAFNAALDRLESGFRLQQSFLAATAHELKTPLALMRGQIELHGHAGLQELLGDVDGMTRQVHQLLHLAEVSEPRNYRQVSLDPGEVALLVDDFLARIAAAASVHVDVRLPDMPVHWLADESALFTLLKNLVENAIQHSPTGGVVTVLVGPDRIDVTDEGGGIADDDAPHVFERYWRSADARAALPTGAGLGLAICREIAWAHGWSLVALPAPRGAHFRLSTAATPAEA